MGFISELVALLLENILQQILELLIGDRFALIIFEEMRASYSLNRSAQFICSDLAILVEI